MSAVDQLCVDEGRDPAATPRSITPPTDADGNDVRRVATRGARCGVRRRSQDLPERLDLVER